MFINKISNWTSNFVDKINLYNYYVASYRVIDGLIVLVIYVLDLK